MINKINFETILNKLFYIISFQTWGADGEARWFGSEYGKELVY